MTEHADIGPFTVDDFDTVSAMVLETWRAGIDLDWSVPAGTLIWSCLQTADHVIDCVFSYALFLASRKQDAYPNFGELHALPEANAADMIDGLVAVTTMLSAVITTTPPGSTAILWSGRSREIGTPNDFAARGGLELILHGHDIAEGLGAPLGPPVDLCERLLIATTRWPRQGETVSTGDPWGDILERSGRGRPRPS